MILFDLKCANDHVFEAWFQDSGAFEGQSKAGEIACPVCGDSAVAKALMAPNLANAGKDTARMGEVMSALGEFRRQVQDNCDYVGEKFPEEARKLHYGETAQRNIYGEASAEDAAALREEGVEVRRLPWPTTHDA